MSRMTKWWRLCHVHDESCGVLSLNNVKIDDEFNVGGHTIMLQFSVEIGTISGWYNFSVKLFYISKLKVLFQAIKLQSNFPTINYLSLIFTRFAGAMNVWVNVSSRRNVGKLTLFSSEWSLPPISETFYTIYTLFPRGKIIYQFLWETQNKKRGEMSSELWVGRRQKRKLWCLNCANCLFSSS